MTDPAFLRFPVAPADGDDRWLSCAVCGYPRHGDGDPVGPRVEFTVRVRTPTESAVRGLHATCWALQALQGKDRDAT